MWWRSTAAAAAAAALVASATPRRRATLPLALPPARARARSQTLVAAEASEPARLSRLLAQPKMIAHGQMREYQLEGLNWMLALHDRGISGILADVRALPAGSCR